MKTKLVIVPKRLRLIEALAWEIGRDDAYLGNPPIRSRNYEKRFKLLYQNGYLAQKKANP